jgi:hypothetical protein
MARLFIKGAQEKVRSKIKSAYGVDISDKGILQQIVAMAKQSYGGNLDLAIRSTQIRDLVMDYAMMTGQKTSGISATPRAISLAESGGSLYEATAYSNGVAQSSISGLATFGGSSSAPMSGAAPSSSVVVPLVLNSTVIGQAVIKDGRVVSQGALNGVTANDSRRELTAAQMSPGTLVS